MAGTVGPPVGAPGPVGVDDGGALDGGSLDGGSLDGGSLLGGPLLGGSLDGGSLEGGVDDGGPLLGGSLDGGSLDGGSLDGGVVADGGSSDGAWLLGGFESDGAVDGGSASAGCAGVLPPAERAPSTEAVCIPPAAARCDAWPCVAAPLAPCQNSRTKIAAAPNPAPCQIPLDRLHRLDIADRFVDPDAACLAARCFRCTCIVRLSDIWSVTN